MCGVQCQFHIFRRGTGYLAKRQARDRGHVRKIFTFNWWNKLTTYVIVIALLEGIGHAQFADVCEIHVVLYLIVGGDKNRVTATTTALGSTSSQLQMPCQHWPHYKISGSRRTCKLLSSYQMSWRALQNGASRWNNCGILVQQL